MEDFMQFSAKTKGEAITRACIELGVSSDQLEIKVISEGSTGFFGFGSKPAIIKARKIETAVETEENEMEKIVESVKIDAIKSSEKKAEKKKEPVKAKEKQPAPKKEKSEKQDKEQPVNQVVEAPAAAEEAPVEEAPVEKEEKTREPKEKRSRNRSRNRRDRKEKPVQQPKEEEAPVEKTVKPSKPIEIITDPEEIKDVENRAVVFLTDVFASMNLGEVEIKSHYNTEDGSLEVDFEGDDMGILIGKRGQTLDSLQYLTSLVVNKGKANYIRVKLDTEDYRRRRKETLENLAKGIAYKVKKSRKSVVLEPMNPYERRIIHSTLQNNKWVETISEGEEPYRHVVVKLKRY